MIRPGNSSLAVYLYAQPIDMRKQMDGLAALVERDMGLPLFSKSLFVFINKRRDKLKILCWEKNGFVVWYKRLEQQRFTWCRAGDRTTINIKELNWLLDGYDIFKFKPHETLKIQRAS